MIEIDGRKGGGQMLRTALTLSAVTGENFELENIRGSRSNPGLKNQHLECVKTAGRLCDAKLEGDQKGSERIVFKPGNIRNESFTSNIGTAGSITLLFDTVLPVTTQFSDSFRFTAKGGTDVKWSPTFNYFKHVKLPLLRKHGLVADIELGETGYYPKGGGKAVLTTEEYSMSSPDLKERGELERFEIYSKASKDLESQGVAGRQADEAAKLLKNNHLSVPIDKNIVYEDAKSTGSSLLVKAVYENSVAGFDAVGEKGKRSEDVAREAVEEFKSFHETDAAVDLYMADQLMIFLALVGGKVSIPEVTEHVQTNLEVIRSFGFDLEIEKTGKKNVLKKV
ncbi:RNA 3'-terminal phosphate cyclase [Candidatus Nanohalobium constans]|uniref:RNA 3'-terminal phosphate cyclase n=1 Tax=Candidatus Nanohalobium constans TaxID=2565781 RepID=A0A5Q0UEN2_9ARCH|nr:RNA 3'-terminal phosphate cyclase [Candidatus Nanohalobium constans]QGA79997.1 RNA 3'-terminal phosphate cyclase (ATP) [Candidatus Nanohalobium constans]